MDNAAAKLEGDVQTKIYVLTEEELKNIVSLGAKEGVKAFRKVQEEQSENREEAIRNSAKFLIIHYKRLRKMEETSVYDMNSTCEPTLVSIFDELLGKVRNHEFDITSIEKNKIKTGMILNHVSVQLDNYKKECELSSILDVQRRYRIVDMMYLREESLSVNKVASIEMIDRSTVYRSLGKAFQDLATLFFGIDGLYQGRLCATKMH